MTYTSEDIRTLRRAHGHGRPLYQRELGERIGCFQQQVSRWERAAGSRGVWVRVIHDRLGVPVTVGGRPGALTTDSNGLPVVVIDGVAHSLAGLLAPIEIPDHWREDDLVLACVRACPGRTDPAG